MAAVNEYRHFLHRLRGLKQRVVKGGQQGGRKDLPKVASSNNNRWTLQVSEWSPARP
jgi:hypothetical protein